MSASLSPIGEPKLIYGRPAYIPAWTPNFTEQHLAIEVKQNGKPLGFKIGDMLPERRWAVQADGELMEQRDFEPLYTQFVSYSVIKGQLVSIPAANGYFDVKLIPIPRVERFANTALDYQGKEIGIGFDPNRPPDRNEAPVTLRDHRGEVAPQNPNDLKVARLTVLADLKAKGLINDEALSSEMASVLLEPQPVPVPPVGFDVVAAVEEPLVFAAPCGFAAKSKAGAAAHARMCEDCKTTPETVEE